MKYSEKKAAQVAAYFIFRSGGRLDILKLMKLMYLAERSSYSQFGEPMIGDNLYSMEHGPVLSSTLDHVNNMIESEPGGWESWVCDRENHFVGLKGPKDPTPSLIHLSDSDLRILSEIWDKFGGMSGSQLRNYTHDNCGEWEDPGQSSAKIPYFRLLKHVGFSTEVAMELNQRITSQRNIDFLFDQSSAG